MLLVAAVSAAVTSRAEHGGGAAPTVGTAEGAEICGQGGGGRGLACGGGLVAAVRAGHVRVAELVGGQTQTLRTAQSARRTTCDRGQGQQEGAKDRFVMEEEKIKRMSSNEEIVSIYRDTC